MNFFQESATLFFKQIRISIKWIVFAVISGITIGSVGNFFFYFMQKVTSFRSGHLFVIFFLPLAGISIVGLYRLFRVEKDAGTNLVLSAIHSGDNIPFQMTPLIFISTIITHLFGGSAGSEGAALQIGGSLGNALGKLFHFQINDKEKNIFIMCGMSASFSAVFGTPLAAAVFPLEVVSVGIMQYSALVACTISALTAHAVSLKLGIAHEHLHIASYMPPFTVQTAVEIGLLAILCAIISILFCTLLQNSEKIFQKHFKNPYIRILFGGSAVTALTLLIGNQDYNGNGFSVIQSYFDGHFQAFAFLLKLLFTVLTISAGFKGGEIFPSFFIGAAFGSLFAHFSGLSPSICVSVGMGAVFCGVTNSPITALLICFELFGFKGMPYYLLTVALSYMFSGYFGLYSSQKIIYSKYRTEYINRKLR